MVKCVQERIFSTSVKGFLLSGELWDDCLCLDFPDDLEQQSSQKFCIEREMNVWYIVIRYLSFLSPWAANHHIHFCEKCHFLTSRFNRDPVFPYLLLILTLPILLILIQYSSHFVNIRSNFQIRGNSRPMGPSCSSTKWKKTLEDITNWKSGPHKGHVWVFWVWTKVCTCWETRTDLLRTGWVVSLYNATIRLCFYFIGFVFH